MLHNPKILVMVDYENQSTVDTRPEIDGYVHVTRLVGFLGTGKDSSQEQ